ncbi:Clavaminate synthase-like protein [Mycena kentingensis (nom. inval.)]|nr:Clavaminate synthase-like protein [Mycena kentingensis (nom. inval.)]
MSALAQATRRLQQVLSGFLIAPDPPPYSPPPTTKQQLDFADLPTIDLSLASTPAGRQALAAEVVAALRTHGFFYVVNHGYTTEQTTRIFSIANETFDGVSDGEKALYMGTDDTVYEGYKPRQTWKIDNGVRDQIEHYNMHRNVHTRAHPLVLRPYLGELSAFARHNHVNVVHPILRLLAIGLELPEETLVREHAFEAEGESSVRFMKYYPRSSEEEEQTKQVWLKGHADVGSITVLWSQPIGGLQILSHDGKWRWVRHVENALVINAGEVMTFLCGGFYPATRHRVVQPPADQRALPRLGVFYFCLANDALRLLPHVESPVLQRVGVKRRCADEDAPTMEEWRRGTIGAYGRSALTKSVREPGVEEELIGKVIVKHFN